MRVKSSPSPAFAAFLSILAVFLSACSINMPRQDIDHTESFVPTDELPSASPPPIATQATTATISPQETEPPRPPPALKTELTRGCQKPNRNNPGPKVGDTAIEFTLLDVNGVSYTLSELLHEKPVVMIFGSFT